MLRCSKAVDVRLSASSFVSPPPPAHQVDSDWWQGQEVPLCRKTVKFRPTSELYKPGAITPITPNTKKQHCVNSSAAVCPAICAHLCSTVKQVIYPWFTGNTAQRTLVSGWPHTSWFWSAMERASGIRKTASADGSTQTSVKPGCMKPSEEERLWKVIYIIHFEIIYIIKLQFLKQNGRVLGRWIRTLSIDVRIQKANYYIILSILYYGLEETRVPVGSLRPNCDNTINTRVLVTWTVHRRPSSFSFQCHWRWI